MNSKYSLPTDLPQPILDEFDFISEMDSSNYGLVFAVRDLYETVLRVLCLSVCVLMEQSGDDSFCSSLFSNKQMSFGDWVNALPAQLKKSNLAQNDPAARNLLKQLTKFYNESGIVRWRNNFIGHGLMSRPEDQNFFTDASQKINNLVQFLTKTPIPSAFSGIDYASASPFFFQEHQQAYLYESVNQMGEIFYLNQTTRRRELKSSTFITEKRKKYCNPLSVTQTQSVWEQNVYLTSEGSAVDGYYLLSHYEKPDYLTQWLSSCLDQYSSGIFLMTGDRSTGKSSFVQACDELNQHGEQKIRLKSDGLPVSARAYFCNHIDFSNLNDFSNQLQFNFSLLPSGEQIRLRSGKLPDPTQNLTAFLTFYLQQYQSHLGREKLVLFIDGIDELTFQNFSILDCIPDPNLLPDHIYIVLTCRNEFSEIPPAVMDFLNRFSFTDKKDFARAAEPHALFVRFLQHTFHITDSEANSVASAFDDRLSVISLLRCLSSEDFQQLFSQYGAELNAGILLNTYLDKLKLCYGTVYFLDFSQFLMCVAEAHEGLTLAEISIMTAHHVTTLREICFLKDASPLFQEIRSYRGNLFFCSNDSLKNALKTRFSTEMCSLLEDWHQQIDNLHLSFPTADSAPQRDALLYYAAFLPDLQLSYDNLPPRGQNFYQHLLNLFQICLTAKGADQIHRQRRAFRGLLSIELTLEQLLQKADSNVSQQELRLFLESTSEALHFAFVLREIPTVIEVVSRVSQCIDAHPELFFTEDSVLRFCVLRYYESSMILFCENYDTQNAQIYYEKAMLALKDFTPDKKVQSEFKKAERALQHNYLGVFRNLNPSGILPVAEKYTSEIANDPDSFSKASDILMVAMCYKSAGDFERTYELLLSASNVLEQILKKRGCTFQALTDAHEQEIYMTVHLRLAQSLNDKMQDAPEQVSVSELNHAIEELDFYITCIIQVSQCGYGFHDMLRLDLMTTSALLRTSAACKLAFNKDSVSEFNRYKEEALQAVHIIELAYQNLDQNHIRYNKINGMFNQMNCACIYASFRDFSRAVQYLQKLLAFYHPENEQETMVYRILQRKLKEFHTMK